MKTLWNETKQVELYLAGKLNTGDTLLFEARMLLNPALKNSVLWQQKTYTAINNYGRTQLKKEIEAVHQKLFTMPQHIGFSQKIRRLFTNQ